MRGDTQPIAHLIPARVLPTAPALVAGAANWQEGRRVWEVTGGAVLLSPGEMLLGPQALSPPELSLPGSCFFVLQGCRAPSAVAPTAIAETLISGAATASHCPMVPMQG